LTGPALTAAAGLTARHGGPAGLMGSGRPGRLRMPGRPSRLRMPGRPVGRPAHPLGQ
jgi:hypothetical protein